MENRFEQVPETTRVQRVSSFVKRCLTGQIFDLSPPKEAVGRQTDVSQSVDVDQHHITTVSDTIIAGL